VLTNGQKQTLGKNKLSFVFIWFPGESNRKQFFYTNMDNNCQSGNIYTCLLIWGWVRVDLLNKLLLFYCLLLLALAPDAEIIHVFPPPPCIFATVTSICHFRMRSLKSRIDFHQIRISRRRRRRRNTKQLKAAIASCGSLRWLVLQFRVAFRLFGVNILYSL
jgi:hypothetical protein